MRCEPVTTMFSGCREDSPGSDDPTVLARAVAERRILLTLDKGFGELGAEVAIGLAW